MKQIEFTKDHLVFKKGRKANVTDYEFNRLVNNLKVAKEVKNEKSKTDKGA